MPVRIHADVLARVHLVVQDASTMILRVLALPTVRGPGDEGVVGLLREAPGIFDQDDRLARAAMRAFVLGVFNAANMRDAGGQRDLGVAGNAHLNKHGISVRLAGDHAHPRLLLADLPRALDHPTSHGSHQFHAAAILAWTSALQGPSTTDFHTEIAKRTKMGLRRGAGTLHLIVLGANSGL